MWKDNQKLFIWKSESKEEKNLKREVNFKYGAGYFREIDNVPRN